MSALPHVIDAGAVATGFALVLVSSVLAAGGLLAINLMRRLLGSAE